MSFALRAVLVFLAGSSLAALWAMYFRYAAAKRPVMAANADVLLITVGSLITIGYVHDVRLLIADLAGTWLGTFLAVRRK